MTVIQQENENKYSVLLYYCYSNIEHPGQFREEHHLFCLALNLRGRIIVAKEGLNGTVSGLKEDCEKYMNTLRADPRFAKIDFKSTVEFSRAGRFELCFDIFLNS